MKFEILISNIEKARGNKLPEHELVIMKKLWNGCVDCVADEFPVLGNWIRGLKQPYNQSVRSADRNGRRLT
jgi:hypothetical protein